MQWKKLIKELIKIIENIFNKKISNIDNLKINSFEDWDSVITFIYYWRLKSIL